MPLTPESLTTLAAFAGVWAVRWAAHDIGDLWAQTHHQALTKGAAGRAGAWSCLKHVLTYEATAAVFFAFAAVFVDFGIDPIAFAAGVVVSGVSHFVADRRSPLRRIAQACNSGDLYQLEQGVHGAFQLDRSWHKAWIFAAALVTAAGTEHLALSLGLCLLVGAAILFRVRRWEAGHHTDKSTTTAVDRSGGRITAVPVGAAAGPQ